ncbi:Cysteine dioxygenase [Kappamyces sp. JEL0829]|nr:Cysteine dioxygenase [Kappamyces sp. JEL0829]
MSDETQLPHNPSNLRELCAMLHKELGNEGLDTADVPKIQKLLESYASNAQDWQSFALFDEGRYTRNLVDDGNGKFNLMVLCWATEARSAIHDHSNSHCLVKVLDGQVEESLYEWPAGTSPSEGELSQAAIDLASPTTPTGITLVRREIYHPNQVTYMHDKIGLHRLSNPSSTKGAVTLHLYSPPYSTCQTFCEKTAIARSSGKICFHSINGVKQNHVEDIYSKLSGLSPVPGFMSQMADKRCQKKSV